MSLLHFWQRTATRLKCKFEPVSSALQRLSERHARIWARIPRYWRDVLVGILVGVSIAVVLPFARMNDELVRLENMAADFVTNFSVLNEEPDPNANLVPFAWVNIDQETYQWWEDPLTLPRDKIWQLIAAAIEGSAAVVLVDIELDKSLGQEGDALLHGCLSEYVKVYQAHGTARTSLSAQGDVPCFNDLSIYEKSATSLPPVFIAASLRPSPKHLRDRLLWKLVREERSEFLRDIPSSTTDGARGSDPQSPLFWGTTTMTYDSDGVIRRIPLFAPLCPGKDGGAPRVLPSLALLTWHYLRYRQEQEIKLRDPDHPIRMKPPHEFIRNLQDLALKPKSEREPDQCKLFYTPGKKPALEFLNETIVLREPDLRKPESREPFGDKKIILSWKPVRTQQRLTYPIGQLNESCESTMHDTPLKLPIPHISFAVHNIKMQVPLITCHSAREVLAKKAIDKEFLSMQFAGRVVVIGASYEESHDFHMTPAGRVPGSLWIINAIESLMEHGQVQEAHKALRYLSLLVFIIVAAIWFPSRWSRWLDSVIPPPLTPPLTGIVLFIVMAPLSIFLFRHGEWLDFGVPFLGMDLLNRWLVWLHREHSAP